MVRGARGRWALCPFTWGRGALEGRSFAEGVFELELERQTGHCCVASGRENTLCNGEKDSETPAISGRSAQGRRWTARLV